MQIQIVFRFVDAQTKGDRTPEESDPDDPKQKKKTHSIFHFEVSFTIHI